jgi:hypothetical protein
VNQRFDATASKLTGPEPRSLEEFIRETISAIVNATSELQHQYETQGILVNPPTAQSGNEVFEVGSGNYTMRRAQTMEFDVAVIAATATGATGKAGIKLLSMGIGGSVDHASSAEQVSRVEFRIPMTLRPSGHEESKLEGRRTEQKKLAQPTSPRPSPGANRRF